MSRAGQKKRAAAAASAALSAAVNPTPDAMLGALAAPVFALDASDKVVEANSAAENFFSRSVAGLRRKSAPTLFGADSRFVDLVGQARRSRIAVSEYALDIRLPERSAQPFDVHVSHFDLEGGVLLVMLHPCSVASKMDRGGAGAARSLSGLSAMMAHEIKNPLAGISGAAQLLEMSMGEDSDENDLLRLIQDEVERIRALVERMDAFEQGGLIERKPINVHDVLDQARRAASAGFARAIRFREIYDPSLPPAVGDRGQLLQAVSNLIKNAAEAAPETGGEITLRTAFRPGVRIAAPTGEIQSLPLEMAVIDNGPGVPDSVLAHVFEPFVTTKSAGTGLGLSLVAKIVSDHGGVVEHERRDDRTQFRILLPVWRGGGAGGSL